jgi:transcription elongation GreA/GreB family factor
MSTREQLILLCQEFITNRQQVVQKVISEIEISLQSETKSSAGDKHETSRAMLQIEREKAGNQLAEITKTKTILNKVYCKSSNQVIKLGSLVYTTSANYFVAISAGKLIANQKMFYAISPSTPIGKLLIGKQTGDKVEFNGSTFKIVRIN